MAAYREPVGAEAEYLTELLTSGVLVDLGVPGVYGRSGAFEDVCNAIDGYIDRNGVDESYDRLGFGPVLPRRIVEDAGYLGSFPHLAGTIFSFEGDERAAHDQEQLVARREDWSRHQHMTDLMLTPAACYPVYPSIARRGPLGAAGVTVDVGLSFVFRHEPAGDPARLQMFRQKERVRIGAAESVLQWRDQWRTRAVELLVRLGLGAEVDVANDPFFGRTGRMLAANQRAQELKYEVVVPISSPQPTAVASFNYHQDHFASVFGIEMASGGPVHTACLGFGVERIALALFRTHGLAPDAWPPTVSADLWP